jgi:hypothetical protein
VPCTHSPLPKAYLATLNTFKYLILVEARLGSHLFLEVFSVVADGAVDVGAAGVERGVVNVVVGRDVDAAAAVVVVGDGTAAVVGMDGYEETAGPAVGNVMGAVDAAVFDTPFLDSRSDCFFYTSVYPSVYPTSSCSL